MKSAIMKLAALAIGIAALAPLTQAPLAPCATEDQETACYWDAPTRGNGQGQSFINR